MPTVPAWQVADGLSPSHPELFKYLNIAVQDEPSEDIVTHFPAAFAFIDEAMANNGGVFVQ